MIEKKIKRRIWLTNKNIKFVNKENDLNVYELVTVNPSNNIERKIIITTKHNLIEEINSNVSKELGFYIPVSVKNNKIWKINDELNSIKIWRRNLKETENNPINKYVEEETQQNLEKKEIRQESPNISFDYQPITTLHDNNMESKLENLEMKILALEKQISYMTLNQKTSTNAFQSETYSDWHNKTTNTLSEILKKLENYREQISSEIFDNFDKKKTVHKRNWKERGYISIRTYSNPQKISLIHEKEEKGKTIRIYLLKTIFNKVIKNITITTTQKITEHSQINFYIQKHLLELNDWNINDKDNQVIFYKANKKYIYVKN